MDDVIDFRFRPVGAQSWTRDTTFHYLERMFLEPCPSFEQQLAELMFDEMDAAGIAIGVIGVPGPTTIRGLDPKGAADIDGQVAEHPDRFIGFGSVEPSDVDRAAAEIRAMAEAGTKGVTIDPSTATVGRRFHDRALYPLYEEAQAGGLLVTTTQSCLLGPYIDDCRPEYVDHVATDFPDLTIVIQHGGWPYVRETIGVLYKQPNVLTVPGQYIHYDFAGSADYIHALKRHGADQIMFGSVYPNCGPLTDLREIIAGWGLPAGIEQAYLRDNAARVLGL
ncbi:MAG: amidohydrolase family protein [Acidimicrobiales bacterium]